MVVLFTVAVGFNEFLFEFEQTTFFLTVGSYVRSGIRLNILFRNSVTNLVVLFCGIMELLAEMNGQLTERRETEFVEKRRKILY